MFYNWQALTLKQTKGVKDTKLNYIEIKYCVALLLFFKKYIVSCL